VYLKIMAAVFIFVNVFFIVAVIKRKFSVIDIGWGPGFILISLISYFHYPLSMKNALLLLAVTIWGLRLGLYIYMRSRGEGEDPRYTKLRREWEPHSNLQAYFKVFILQGFMMCVVSLPIWMGMAQEDKTLSLINIFGFFLWFAGFALEVWSDAYLNKFKKQPENKGKLCTSGPWRICRYPNYLGEIALWYGIYLLSLGSSNWWTVAGPMVINILIVKFSGIPPQEERNQRRPEYAAYAARVPRLLPFKL
jgi:steroid 5-alpha reductase family enzyme